MNSLANELLKALNIEKTVDILTFAEHPDYLGRQLYPKQKEILQQLFSGKYNELVLIAGRRGTKTFMASIIASYLAYLWLQIPDPYEKFKGLLDRGTPVYIINVATKQAQAKILFDEIEAKITTSPYFKDKIEQVNAYQLRLKNGLILEAVTSNSASEVGRSALAVIFDEIGRYGEEEGTRDGEEVYNSISKSIATFASSGSFGKIISISTPMGKSGILWTLYNMAPRIPSMLLLQLPTWELNPNLPYSCDYLAQERAKSPKNFDREFGAQFVDVVDAFLPLEKIMACVYSGTSPQGSNYYAAIDASVKKDAFAFAAAHKQGNTVYIDIVKRWLPVNGAVDWISVCEMIRILCNQYGITKIVHDQYQTEAVKQHLRGFNLVETTFTQPYKMMIFNNLEELINQRQIMLPNDDQLIRELQFLQKKYNGENFSVHHPSSGPVQNDDLADVVANVAYQAATSETGAGDYSTPIEFQEDTIFPELFGGRNEFPQF